MNALKPFALALAAAAALVACDGASDELRTVVEGIAVEATTGTPLENMSVTLYGFGSGPVSLPIAGYPVSTFAGDTTGTDGRFSIGTNSRQNGDVRVAASDLVHSLPGYDRFYYSPTNLPQYVRMGRHTRGVRIEFVLVDREAATPGRAEER